MRQLGRSGAITLTMVEETGIHPMSFDACKGLLIPPPEEVVSVVVDQCVKAVLLVEKEGAISIGNVIPCIVPLSLYDGFPFWF